jgi:hypothetical protein
LRRGVAARKLHHRDVVVRIRHLRGEYDVRNKVPRICDGRARVEHDLQRAPSAIGVTVVRVGRAPTVLNPALRVYDWYVATCLEVRAHSSKKMPEGR